MLLLQRCASRKFHVIDGQNTRDQITSDRRSKRAWSNCVYVHSIHSWWKSKRMLPTYMRHMHNNNLEIRIAGSCCCRKQACIALCDKQITNYMITKIFTLSPFAPLYPFSPGAPVAPCIVITVIIQYNTLFMLISPISLPTSLSNGISRYLCETNCMI